MQANLLRRLKILSYWGGVILVALLSAEAMARLHDWLQYGEPFMAVPSLERNLRQSFSDGTRGKPLGSYRCCRLNSLGFRGVEIDRSPNPEQVRVAFLGASEIFGSCAVDKSEIPARVKAHLKDFVEFEIVNTAVVGMTITSIHKYWTTWVSRIRPTVVLIYANPMFELNLPDRRSSDLDAAGRVRPQIQKQPLASRPPKFSSRFLDALKNRFTFPDWIQEWRNVNSVARIVSLHPEGWAFSSTPRDRVNQFIESLQQLIESIEASGANVVLMTHAIAVKSLSDPGDLRFLRHGRTFCPRALEQVLIDYSDAVNAEIRQLARSENIPLIDIAADFDGRREQFVDLVHFNAAGEEAVSEIIAEFLISELRDQQY